jgi:hypothetical protein
VRILLLPWLRADDVPIVEEHEESPYGAFRCLDPGGHRSRALGTGQVGLA